MSDSSDETLYPVSYIYHRNRYGSTLFDVDGRHLLGESGSRLNVFKEEMKDMLAEKKVRCIHYMTKEPTYIYFVIDQEQVDRFQWERDNGSYNPKRIYHVYLDD